MSRFSPSVLPTSGAAAGEMYQGFADSLGQFFAIRRQKKEDDLRAQVLEEERGERADARKSRALSDALREAELYEAGIRRGPAPADPTRSEPIETPDLFRGQPMGMAPAQGGRRSPLAGALEGFEGAQIRKPKVVALPGAIVPGHGFAERTLFDTDFETPPADTRVGLQRPQRRSVSDPRHVQLGEDFYLDTSETPSARAAAQRGQAGRALELLRDLSPEEADAVLEGLEAGLDLEDLLPGAKAPVRGTSDYEAMLEREAEIEARHRPPSAPVRGSQAYNDALRSELEIREDFEDAPGSSGDASEVTQRQMALAAARALAELQQNRTSPADINPASVGAVLRPYGYQSAQELFDHMRTLRIGPGAAGAPAGAPAAPPAPAAGGQPQADLEPTPEEWAEIDRLIDQGVTPTDAARAIRLRRSRGGPG